MTSKKIILVSLCLPHLLLGDFIGSAISSATSGSLSSLQSSALNWITTTGASGATNFLFNSDSMSGFWNSMGGTYTTGTIDMCYKRASQRTAATPDMCSLLGNTSLDPCTLMPSTIMGGLYAKKSSSDQMKAKAPLRDWCKKTLQTDTAVAVGDIKNYMGISGKRASDLRSGTATASTTTDFLSSASKSVSDKSASLSGYLDATGERAVRDNRSSYAKKNRLLQEAGMGHVANAEIEKIATLNKDITNEQLANLDMKVAFSNMDEYKGDLLAKTASDGAAYRQFFNYEAHVDIANAQFASLNQQQKTITDKKNFIDEYVENETSGLRKQYRIWAEDMAKQEIMYTPPAKGEKYYSSFDEKNVLNNVKSYSMDRDVAISIANYQITKQQYNEKSVMLKWRTLADAKADELKVLLVKNMYASEIFNEAAARAEIAQLMSAN